MYGQLVTRPSQQTVNGKLQTENIYARIFASLFVYMAERVSVYLKVYICRACFKRDKVEQGE